MQIATIGLKFDTVKLVMPTLAAIVAVAAIKSSRDPDIKTSLLTDCPAEEVEEEEDPDLIIKIEEILDSNDRRRFKEFISRAVQELISFNIFVSQRIIIFILA